MGINSPGRILQAMGLPYHAKASPQLVKHREGPTSLPWLIHLFPYTLQKCLHTRGNSVIFCQFFSLGFFLHSPGDGVSLQKRSGL